MDGLIALGTFSSPSPPVWQPKGQGPSYPRTSAGRTWGRLPSVALHSLAWAMLKAGSVREADGIGVDGLLAQLRRWSAHASIEGRLAGGTRCDTWAVRIGERPYVARRSTRSEAALAWEADLLRYLAGCGLSVPEPLPAADGRLHADGLIVLTWLEGRAPQTAREWREAATALKRLHDLTRGWPQRPGFASSLDLLTRDRGGDVDLGNMPGDVADLLRSAWAPLRGLPQSVVHGDSHAGNLLVDGRGIGIIDWDEARVDVSCLDFSDFPADVRPQPHGLTPDALAMAGDAWEVACSWALEPDYAPRRLASLLGRKALGH